VNIFFSANIDQNTLSFAEFYVLRYEFQVINANVLMLMQCTQKYTSLL